jgi:cellulose synthase/poly-beta-1,6-N-acetylglucosamine synthase-like glycosyltransferase
MILIIAIWGVLFSIFLGVPSAYYLYMKHHATKPWSLKIDENYEPHVSILVPMHNEEKPIRFKLENLYKVTYPAKKLQIILVNDASTDKTLDEIHEFMNSHDGPNIKVLNRLKRAGKSDSLNFALKSTNSEIIVVSDADCFWSSDTLIKALPYISNSEVGAVAGKEILLNPQRSWVTEGELFYNNFVQTLRLGESKVHSTIFFQGGFAAYKKAFLEEFDHENDDSGTAFNIVQGKRRTLIIPEAHFYTMFPTDWKNKVILKMRRANQLQRMWIKCLKLLLQRKLVLPKRIAVPEIFLHIFNPIIFFVLILTTALVIVAQPLLLAAFLPILLLALAIPKSRISIIENVQSNFILLFALFSLITGRQFKHWKTVEESRSYLTKEVLKENQLI